MSSITFALDPESPLGLQRQLRQKIVEAILNGVLQPGCRLPSSRALAGHLGISRNTVTLAYAALVAKGHLVGHKRSGIFVSDKLRPRPSPGHRGSTDSVTPTGVKLPPVATGNALRCPPDWQQYPYAFFDGCIDPTLTPLPEWREAIRLACSPGDAHDWSMRNDELDDPLLVAEIRRKILPERGIDASPEEVLVMTSARQGLQMLAELLVHPGTPVWLEEPVDTEFLQALRNRGAMVERFDPDCPHRMPRGVIVITSARKGIESGSATPCWLPRAIASCDGVLIEQDMPPDVNESAGFAPALYATGAPWHVIYVRSVSPVVAGGIPLATVVAAAPVINRLRRLRCASGAAPGCLQQRAWSYFISLGHYTAAQNRVQRVLGERRHTLREALNHYLHALVTITTMPGASAYWVRCRDDCDAEVLARRAAAQGVLIWPGQLPGTRNAFGMGVTGIAQDRIRKGVLILARLIHEMTNPRGHGLQGAGDRRLKGTALRRAISGKTIVYNTVYGKPCLIKVRPNGELVGIEGHVREDIDRGRWWVEDDHWFRQWDRWSYGERAGYHVALAGDEIRWFDDNGVCVDRAIISHQ